MPKRFLIRKPDLNNVKDWLAGQIRKGRLTDMILADVDMIRSVEDAQRIVDRSLEQDARKRLQVALAVRRSRTKSKPQVVTQLDDDAREILLKVAHSRNLTTSELIRTAFLEDYLKLQ